MPPLLSLKSEWIARAGNRIIGPISFSLEPEQTIAITGPSGVGKTSLLRVLAGLDHDFAGERHAPEQIGMVFQEPALMPWRNVLDNLNLTTGHEDDHIGRSILEKVGLAGFEARFPDELSLGQQRRVALARAFALDSPLLLMDEPFVSLDDDMEDSMMSLMETLRKKHRQACVIVTHEMEQAERLADHIFELKGQPASLTPLRV